MSEAMRGSCVCGTVRFTIEGPFLAFQNCHCSRCRKASGSAHATNLFVAADQLTWTAGGESMRRFELPDAKYWSCAFCSTCGSSLPWLTGTGKVWVVPAGGLDDDPGIVPNRNIFYGSRAEWYVHAHLLETHDEFPSG